MTIQEEAAERIMQQALDDGGEVMFCQTELDECEDSKFLKDVNLILSMYGSIHGMMISDRWICFKIGKIGYDFLKGGGFKGEERQESRKEEIDALTYRIAKLQEESLQYQKRIRIWQAVCAFLTLVIGTLAVILS